MWPFKKKKNLEIKYCRIRKPKKGEKIFFRLPTNNQEELNRFCELLEKAFKSKGSFVVISRDIRPSYVTKKKIKNLKKRR